MLLNFYEGLRLSASESATTLLNKILIYTNQSG